MLIDLDRKQVPSEFDETTCKSRDIDENKNRLNVPSSNLNKPLVNLKQKLARFGLLVDACQSTKSSKNSKDACKEFAGDQKDKMVKQRVEATLF